MPAYDYRCGNCEEVFEECAKFPRDFSKCPECGGKSRRIFSAPNIVFKGSGFYINDYKENKQRNREE